jgi:hypothetical protein
MNGLWNQLGGTSTFFQGSLEKSRRQGRKGKAMHNAGPPKTENDPFKTIILEYTLHINDKTYMKITNNL